MSCQYAAPCCVHCIPILGKAGQLGKAASFLPIAPNYNSALTLHRKELIACQIRKKSIVYWRGPALAFSMTPSSMTSPVDSASTHAPLIQRRVPWMEYALRCLGARHSGSQRSYCQSSSVRRARDPGSSFLATCESRRRVRRFPRSSCVRQAASLGRAGLSLVERQEMLLNEHLK